VGKGVEVGLGRVSLVVAVGFGLGVGSGVDVAVGTGIGVAVGISSARLSALSAGMLAGVAMTVAVEAGVVSCALNGEAGDGCGIVEQAINNPSIAARIITPILMSFPLTPSWTAWMLLKHKSGVSVWKT